MADSRSYPGAPRWVKALLVLLVATTLSVYKPLGMTRYGWRKQRGQRTSDAS